MSRLVIRIGIAAIGLATVGALGAGVAALAIAPTTPHSLLPPEEIEDVPVVVQSYDDPRPVEVGFTLEPDVSISSPSGGRVTAYSCRPGAVLASGESQLSVDGAPTLTLATATPLWRDLVVGDRGEDVAALQAELARLGAALQVDGVLGGASIDALESLLRQAGDPQLELEMVPAARIVWVPSPTTTASTCELSLGAGISPDVVVATVPGTVSSAEVVGLPKEMASGARSLEVDSLRLSVDAVGRVSGDDALAQFAESKAFLAALRAEGESSVSGRLVLTEPAEIGVVPPSAVYSISDGLGCVGSKGEALAVRVVGSQLGQTFVSFEDGTIPDTVESRPTTSRPCR